MGEPRAGCKEDRLRRRLRRREGWQCGLAGSSTGRLAVWAGNVGWQGAACSVSVGTGSD